MEVCHLQQVESNHPPITESYREAVLPNIFLAAFVLFHHSVHFSLFLGARQNRTSFSVVSACHLHVRLGDRTNLYRIGWGTRPLWCFGSTSCARKTKTEAYARAWSAWRQKRKCMLELVLRGRRKRKRTCSAWWTKTEVYSSIRSSWWMKTREYARIRSSW